MSRPRNLVVFCLFVLAAAVVFAPSARAQWNPGNGQWGKDDPLFVRVMTWNVKDGICSTNDKQEGRNNWTALVVIVAAMQPDVLILQEAGDNDGNGTGSSGDSVYDLETTMDLFLNGGNDPYHGNVPVTAYVEKYAPGYTLPYVFVSSETDGWNRNVIASRFSFKDLNGDNKSKLSDIPYVNADQYAPGGDGGIRGFQFAEIDLPDQDYLGDLVVGNAHLKAGSSGSSPAQRLEAGKNTAYLIDYWFNGAGTGIPDPRNKINDNPPATRILDADTPVIWGGDWNEDEASNGRDGPALWMVRAQYDQSSGNDGTDRDRSDSIYDAALNPITGSRATIGSSKFDYLARQDSIAIEQLSFIFDSGGLASGQLPPEVKNFQNPNQASTYASDHLPVIADYELPVAGGAGPVPDIKVDGDDGPLTVSSGQTVVVTAGLDPKSFAGVKMDWWIIARKSGGGAFSWAWPGSWVPGIQRAIAWPLVPLPGYPLYTGPIPVGTWTIEFAVDDLDNVYQGTYSDTVEVTSI